MTPLSPDVQRIVDSIYPPQRQALAAQLSSLEITLFIIASALQLALVFGFFSTGWSRRLRDALESRWRQPLAVSAAFLAIAYAGLAIVLLPLDWYGGYVIPHRFGLSLESPATWFHDWAVGGLISLIVLLVLALPFGALVRRLGWRWTIVAGIAAAPLILFGNVIFPVYVAPLFNTYTQMPPSPLTTSILALAKREGIDASAVYVYDISRQTTESNAYVAGLGPTARIAIGDNLLKAPPDEVLYVVAHEMGHYKLHHIWWGSLYAWLGALAAIACIAWAGSAAVRRAGPARARSLDDPAALPLLAALLLAFGIIAQPVANGVSRGIEHAADAFAASTVHSDHAGVRAFARLGSEGLSVLHPSPAVVWYFYTHPPLDARIAYAADAESESGHPGLTGFPK